MKDLTQQEQEDVAFYNEVHASNSYQVNGIWRSRSDSEIVSDPPEEDQKQYYRGREFDNLGSYSVNGVPVSADQMRQQLRETGKY